MSDYNVTLLPAQRKFWEIDHDYPIDVALYQGGYGSGKTFCGSLLGITLALKYPKIRGLVGALTVPLLRDTTLSAYFEHLDALGIKYTFLKSENKIIFPNKSEILFRHLEDGNVLKSLNLGFVEVEEMSDIPKDTFEVLLSRLRQKALPEWGEGFRHRLFGHTNPQIGRGWIWEFFNEKKLDGYRKIIAPTTQNIHLPKGYIELLRNSYNEDLARLMIEGLDDDIINNLVTRGFKKDLQVLDTLQIDRTQPIHLTCDFNVDPMCWYIAQHYNGNIYYLHECVEDNTTTDHAAQLVCELLADYKQHRIIINGDASGNHDTTKGNDYIFLRNAFKRNGFENVEVRVLNHNPSIKYRLDCWNAKIKAPDNQPHIFIHPQCKWLLYNIDTLEIQPGTSKPKLPSPSAIQKDYKKKYLGHPIDAASYLVCMYYPIRLTDFKTFENKPMNTDIFNGKYDSRLI